MPAGGDADRLRTEVVGQLRQAAPRASASPSMAMVAPRRAARARSRSANGTSGWKLAAVVPGAWAEARTLAGRAPLVWTMACPAQRRMLAATVAMTSSGTVSEHQVDEIGQAPPGRPRSRAPGTRPPASRATLGVAAGDRHHRPAGPVDGDAERACPTRPGTDDADARVADRACSGGGRSEPVPMPSAWHVAGWHVPRERPDTAGVSSKASTDARPETGTPVRSRPSLARRGEDSWRPDR